MNVYKFWMMVFILMEKIKKEDLEEVVEYFAVAYDRQGSSGLIIDFERSGFDRDLSRAVYETFVDVLCRPAAVCVHNRTYGRPSEEVLGKILESSWERYNSSISD